MLNGAGAIEAVATIKSGAVGNEFPFSMPPFGVRRLSQSTRTATGADAG